MTPGQQNSCVISITWWDWWCGGLTTIQFRFARAGNPSTLYYNASFFSRKHTANLKHCSYIHCAPYNNRNQNSSERSHFLRRSYVNIHPVKFHVKSAKDRKAALCIKLIISFILNRLFLPTFCLICVNQESSFREETDYCL
jgi:hypothetical protein